MNHRHAVRAMGADDGQIRHADFPATDLLNQTDAFHAALVAGKFCPHFIDQAPVDFVNEFQMARQQFFKPGDGPFFKGLGQQRMVRISQCPPGDVPGIIPAELGVIQEDAQQFGHGHGRVRVVELDRGMIGQLLPIGICFAKTADEIGQRTGHKEIFLHKTQRFAPDGRIVGIQHAGE